MRRGDMHGHYEKLASGYETHWTYRPDYAAWMAAQIKEALSLTSEDRMADIGCGTGMFTREIAQAVRPRHPVLCVDPSESMLRQLGTPPPSELLPVHASAEDIAESRIPLPYGQLDAIWLKEAVHHLPEPAGTLAGLARRLSRGGRLLVAMLPATIEYPLFATALKRYEELQPDPADIVRHLQVAGLRARMTHVEHELRISRDRYIEMVRARYMSVLSTFTDAELAQGIEEIKATHPGGELVFPDRFAFVLGVREGVA